MTNFMVQPNAWLSASAPIQSLAVHAPVSGLSDSVVSPACLSSSLPYSFVLPNESPVAKNALWKGMMPLESQDCVQCHSDSTDELIVVDESGNRTVEVLVLTPEQQEILEDAQNASFAVSVGFSLWVSILFCGLGTFTFNQLLNSLMRREEQVSNHAFWKKQMARFVEHDTTGGSLILKRFQDAFDRTLRASPIKMVVLAA